MQLTAIYVTFVADIEKLDKNQDSDQVGDYGDLQIYLQSFSL